MQKWEYKVEWIGSVSFSEDYLNKAGKDGWELIGIYHDSGSSIAVFKRPKGV